VFTVAYVVRDDVAAALHRVHRCADVVVVLGEACGGWRFQHVPWPSPFERAGVTPREAEVLALLLARFTNAEIGRELVVAPATVRAHCRSLFCKLAVAGRRDLWARFAGIGAREGHSARAAETRNTAASVSMNPAQTVSMAR
jgi:DNA-binding CsgD family transcriptional regulator